MGSTSTQKVAEEHETELANCGPPITVLPTKLKAWTGDHEVAPQVTQPSRPGAIQNVVDGQEIATTDWGPPSEVLMRGLDHDLPLKVARYALLLLVAPPPAQKVDEAHEIARSEGADWDSRAALEAIGIGADHEVPL